MVDQDRLWTNARKAQQKGRAFLLHIMQVGFWSFNSCDKEMVRKRVFLCLLYCKMIILPRQARDKHRQNSKKDAFLQGKATIDWVTGGGEGGEE
jgi:hypothetical protein